MDQKSPLTYYNITLDNIVKYINFLLHREHSKVQITSFVPIDDFSAELIINNKKYYLKCPKVIDFSPTWDEEISGTIIQCSNRTYRFCRLHIGNEFVTHFTIYPYKELPQNSYCYFNFWALYAHIIIKSIIRDDLFIPQLYQMYYNDFIMKFELLTSSLGKIVMSQEIALYIPETSANGSISEVFTRKELDAFSTKIQLSGLDEGYLLSGTSKSNPGDILTRIYHRSASGRGLISQLFMGSPIERKCRAPRELRQVRAAIELDSPVPIQYASEGLLWYNGMEKYFTALNTLVCDFKMNVPSTDQSKWVRDKNRNKDKVLLHPSGKPKIATLGKVTKTLSEEEFLAREKELSEKEGFYVVDIDFIYMDGAYVKNYRVEYIDFVAEPSHVKLITVSGLKGITDPMTTQLYGSVIELDSESDIENLIESRQLFPIDVTIAASAIYSKKSHVLLSDGLIGINSWIRNKFTIIPNRTNEEWCSSERSKEVDSKGRTYNTYTDTINTLINNITTEFYVYRMDEEGILIPVINYETQLILKAPILQIPWFRTRHSDDYYGGENRAFGISNEDRLSGVALCFNGAKLSGKKIYVSERNKEYIDTAALNLKLLDNLIKSQE